MFHVYAVPYEARRGRWIPLGLDWQMVVSCHVGAWYQKWVIQKNRQCS